jgi:hypothetical protein
MSNETTPKDTLLKPPMKIWFYKEMEALPLPTVDIECSGNFYSDISSYCEQADIAIHPCFKLPQEYQDPSEFNIDKLKSPSVDANSTKKLEEPTYLQVFSKKIDKNSIQALMTVLPYSKIETLKYDIRIGCATMSYPTQILICLLMD